MRSRWVAAAVAVVVVVSIDVTGFGRNSGIRSLMAFLQMMWQPSLLIQKRKYGPPLGLKNLGNTCYLNSVLQCLTYTPPLANFCLKFQHSSSCDSADTTTEKKRECPFCLLEKRIARSLSIDSSLDAPAKINSCLRIFSEHFMRGRQEDAHEFLRYVIDACHNTCLRLEKLQLQRRNGGSVLDSGNGSTIVKEIFGGALQSQVKCLSCGSESNKVDEIMDISLDIWHSVSLKDAFQRFFQPETLDGNNKYKCDNCKKLVAARKQMSILQAPNVLVIQLKRFGGIFGEKIDKAIAFEEVLELSSYMCKASQDLHPEYKLFGTIVHLGCSPDSGHYFSYIKDAMGNWYCCNDSYVSLSTLQEVVSEKAYILFFARSKQRPSAVKGGLLANGSKCHQSNGSDESKDKRSGQSERSLNTKLLPDHHSVFSNSIPSKVDKVPSGPSRKLGIFENCDIRKPHANGGIKVIVQEKEPFEKTCNTTSSSDAEGNHKNVNVLKDMNGVNKARLADAIDPGMVINSSIANGNGKIQHVGAVSLDRKLFEDDDRKNNITTRRTPERREFCNSDGKCHSDSSGLKRKSNDKALFISHATDFTIGRNPEHRESSNGNLKLHDRSGLKRKSKDADPSILLGNGATRGRDPEHKELFNGDVKCHSGSSRLKTKAQDKDLSLLLAKDTQSRTRVDEFKKVIGKEDSLVLQSSGWLDEVYNFMHSRKRLCIEEGKYKCHQSNGSDASKDKRSGQSERSLNTKLLPDHHPVFSNSIPSKVDMVPSGQSRKLGIFENCDIRKPHANGDIKIIVHKKEPFEKTCNTTSSSDAEGNHKNVNVLKDMNGVNKARPADAIDPGMVINSSIANGNGKIQHVGADSLGRKFFEDARKNNMTRRTPERREFCNSDGKCHSDSSGLKRKSNDKALSISHATGFTIGRNPEHRESSNGNLKLHDRSRLKRKSKDADPSILLGNDATRGRDPEHKELFNGDVKCHSGSSRLKTKAQDKDLSLLLAKDTQSRTRVDEFKKVIGKEASLVLQSSGWLDEVYNFMRSRKRLCIEGKYDATRINEMKRLLMADAKSAFLSKVPESLKGDLVKRLVLLSQQKQSPGT